MPNIMMVTFFQNIKSFSGNLHFNLGKHPFFNTLCTSKLVNSQCQFSQHLSCVHNKSQKKEIPANTILHPSIQKRFYSLILNEKVLGMGSASSSTDLI